MAVQQSHAVNLFPYKGQKFQKKPTLYKPFCVGREMESSKIVICSDVKTVNSYA